MAKSNPKTCEEYVLEKLNAAEATICKLEHEVATRDEDIRNFTADFNKIKEHFVVKASTANNCLKITFFKDPEDKYDSGEILCFSDSVEPENWGSKFTSLVQLLHLDCDAALEELRGR